MHHALHKVVKRMGGQTTKARGARGVRGVHTFLIAKNAPYNQNCHMYYGPSQSQSTWDWKMDMVGTIRYHCASVLEI